MRQDLRDCIESKEAPPADYSLLKGSSLASWIEGTFGLREEDVTGKLVRQVLQPILADKGAVA